MKFRTTIQIVTEASNKDEALEIVGEYLSGNLSSGVRMSCATQRLHNYNKPAIVSVMVTTLVLAIEVLAVANLKPTATFTGTMGINCAVQPPLKTSEAAKKQGFKNEWEKKQVQEALDIIKK